MSQPVGALFGQRGYECTTRPGPDDLPLGSGGVCHSGSVTGGHPFSSPSGPCIGGPASRHHRLCWLRASRRIAHLFSCEGPSVFLWPGNWHCGYSALIHTCLHSSVSGRPIGSAGGLPSRPFTTPDLRVRVWRSQMPAVSVPTAPALGQLRQLIVSYATRMV